MAHPKHGFGEIAPTQLMRLIGTPDAPVILDVCLPQDVAQDPNRIPTSHAASHTDLNAILLFCDGKDVVVVCQKGKKLSHGTAALLRAKGINAEALAGGIMAWRTAGLPTTAIDRRPETHRWVTRHRPKIDRIACPWLIRRFVDSQAEILYVPPAEVTEIASRFDATAFDTPDAPFTHKGDHCTFDHMLAHFGLETPALLRMADVVRAADTGNADVPQAAGLLALSVGLSRMHKDDQAQLAAAMPLYDALYRWARDGQNETHDWDTETGQ